MTVRVIANKRIELTDDEFLMYQNICNSYTKDNFDGKQLFCDLFETDEEGLIVYLKPPKKMFSLEVVLFLQNIMVQQHLRKIYKEHNEALKEFNEFKNEVHALLSELKQQKSSSETSD